LTEVYNLNDPKNILYYFSSPRDAVIAAYAYFTCHDGNTWQYEERYGGLVQFGHWFVFCGDFASKYR